MIKKITFLFLIVSITGCGITHHKSITDRKRGFMLLENTSQSMNKKYKKTRFAKKAERKHRSGKNIGR